ncbi:MAG: hypothetical protein KF847_05825 [Pirellulales bacterium]|nr:hypothetical protein [Pirellulales bacterium]
MPRISSLLLLAAFGWFGDWGAGWSVPAARARLVSIEYYDRGVINPEYAGGPLWTGVVDTTTNTLTINTWIELPLHGAEFWVPQNLPLVWPAKHFNDLGEAADYDVPDDFDGTIDQTWAFISDQTLREMAWKAPVFNYNPTPPILVDLVDATFTLSTIDLRPGWGGFAISFAADPTEFTYLFANPSHTTDPDNSATQPPFDERIMPVLPVGPTDFTRSSEATVSIIASTPTSVPEAQAWQFAALASLAASASWLLRSGRRSSP